MKYKEFNLEDALAGKPVMTRDVDEVTEIAFLQQARSDSQVVVVIKGLTFFYDENGKRNSSGSHVDLVMKPTKVTKFINVYINDNNELCVMKKLHNSLDAAMDSQKSLSHWNWIANGIEIEIEIEV